MNAYFKYAANRSLSLQLEPFALRTSNYPVFFEDENRWENQTIENYGLRFLFKFNFWKFELNNDFTYNHNYQEAFAPKFNNISMLKLSFPLLKKALIVDGVLTARYIDRFKLINFNRLLYQYRLTDQENTTVELTTGPKIIGAPYNIVDARIQLHFHNATIFFVWENLISQDYLFVNNTLESLLIFRLGIDWLFFD